MIKELKLILGIFTFNEMFCTISDRRFAEILRLDGSGTRKLEVMAWALPLSHRVSGQRLSLYADDVALFIKLVEEELQVSKEILNIFGSASGLQTNLHKSSIIPIRCEEASVAAIMDNLPCNISEFP